MLLFDRNWKLANSSEHLRIFISLTLHISFSLSLSLISFFLSRPRLLSIHPLPNGFRTDSLVFATNWREASADNNNNTNNNNNNNNNNNYIVYRMNIIIVNVFKLYSKRVVRLRVCVNFSRRNRFIFNRGRERGGGEAGR